MNGCVSSTLGGVIHVRPFSSMKRKHVYFWSQIHFMGLSKLMKIKGDGSSR